MSQRWTDEMLDKLADDIQQLTNESKEQSIRFAAYQQSTQWVVQLAFSLIASATLTVIITTVFKR
jgi:hypothetical protein